MKTRWLIKTLRFPLTRIFVGGLACLTASQVVNGLLKRVLDQSEAIAAPGKMIRVSVNLAAMLAAYYGLFRLWERRKISELAAKHFPREAGIGFLAAVLVVSLIIGSLWILGYYEPAGINRSLFLQLYSLVIILTMAAAEEILIRGILYRITEASLGTPLALAISGLFFGLFHLRNENATYISAISITLGGIVLGLAFSSSRRLWYPIFLHAGWNYAQAFYGAVLSGMNEYSSYGFIRGGFKGPDLLTGGAFGPENSILAILITLISAIWLYARLRKWGGVTAPFWKRGPRSGRGERAGDGGGPRSS